MSGPFPFSREAMSLDTMLEQVGGAGWAGLQEAFKPAPVPDAFEPENNLKEMLAAFYRTPQGRQMFDWLADLTVRAPYPHVGSSLESAGIAAAKHEARFAVGSVIFQAVADGEKSLNNRSQSHEKSI